jgi:lipid A 4'-phosphatase
MARRLMLIAAASAVLAAVIFLSVPRMDLLVGALFVDSEGRFIGRHQILVEQTRDALMWVPYAIGAICLAGLLMARRKAWLSLRFSQWLFLAVCLVVGPGLIANVVLKEHSGRARPAQIVEHGGTKAFSPPLLPAGQCPKNCSFVSGEASLIFMIFFATALMLPRRLLLLTVIGVVWGMAVGAIRMSQGAHFLSDVVFAGLFMALTAAILHELMFGGVIAWSRAGKR